MLACACALRPIAPRAARRLVTRREPSLQTNSSGRRELRGRGDRAVDRAVARAGEALVAHCAEFFDEGPERLVPVPMRTLVDAVAMHESTVQRVLVGKRLRCRHGAFALESFVRHVRGRKSGDGTER